MHNPQEDEPMGEYEDLDNEGTIDHPDVTSEES